MSISLLCIVICFIRLHETGRSTEYKITDWRRCPDPKTRNLAIQKLSMEDCVQQCKIRPICKAISYRRLFRLCEIYSTKSDIVLKSAGRSPCVFVEKQDIKQDNLPCNCTDGQICNVSDGQCIVKECEPYDDADVNVHGNKNEINSKIKLSCHPTWGKSNLLAVCNPNGTWSGKLECPHLNCPEGNSWLEQESSTPGFILGFILQFNLVKLNHSSARRKCEDSGTRLVRINSVEKREYITRLCTLCEGLQTYFWTDGSSGSNKMWFSDGTRMPLDEIYWEPDRPDISDSEAKCARLEFNYEYRWRDAYCSEEFFYICEK